MGTKNCTAAIVLLCLLCLPTASAESSAVKVSTDKSNYDFGKKMVVTIANTLSVPIFALTGQTYCTILTRPRISDSEGNSQGPCQSYGPPGWVKIASGPTTRIELWPRLPADK